MVSTKKARASFDDIKKRISIIDVLLRYSFEPSDLELLEGKTQLRLPCPICDYEGKSFSASTVKNVFKCFHCNAQGNVLNLVASLEETTVPKAAKLLSEWFPVSQERSASRKTKRKVATKKVKVDEPARTTTSVDVPEEPKTEPVQEQQEESDSTKEEVTPKIVNSVLGFELRGIDSDHPDVARLGISLPAEFGIGYYGGRGFFANQVVCPIRNQEGMLMAYCGIAIEEGKPRITYPEVQHFAKDADLYCPVGPTWSNQQEAGSSIILVQSPLQAVLLTERGFNAVAFMADIPGTSQIRTLYDLFTEHDVQIMYCYEDTDTDEHIGRVVRSLADIALIVEAML